MKLKKSLNAKRLTREQVQELITTEGTLHPEFSTCFARSYSEVNHDRPLVYELPGDRFLFVFDPRESALGGKGDIYAGEYFRQWVRSPQRHQQDLIKGCYSSVSHWFYYSEYKQELIHNTDFLVADLAAQLAIAPQLLDFSYPSLDILTQGTTNYGYLPKSLANSPPNTKSSYEDSSISQSAQADFALVDAVSTALGKQLPRVRSPQSNLVNHLYDHLVAYIGEVLRRRVKGEWAISDKTIDESSSCFYPYARSGANQVLMPINVVWEELVGVSTPQWRQATIKEIRRFSLRIMG